MGERLLVDTHVLIWLLARPDEVKPDARSKIEDPSSETFVSIASFWECSIKLSLGKLTILDERIRPELRGFAAATRDVGLEFLPITIAHTERVRDLPLLHRDPFDRMLVAQAIEENLTLVTRDPEMIVYPGLRHIRG